MLILKKIKSQTATFNKSIHYLRDQSIIRQTCSTRSILKNKFSVRRKFKVCSSVF